MPDNVIHLEPNAFERFKAASEKGKFSIDAELNILTYLIERYKFVNLSEYARQNNISPAAAFKRVESGNVMYIEIAGIKMIIPENK
jgi:hypothetical protein